MLYNLYYNPGTIDNNYTTDTQNAVMAFQSDMGLYVDGWGWFEYIRGTG